MFAVLSLALAAAQPVSLPVEMTHGATDEYEDILYRVMREVKAAMPPECAKLRVRINLVTDELKDIGFACLDRDDNRLPVAIDPVTMPMGAFAARYERLRVVLDDKATRGHPYGVSMTVDRRGRLHTQLYFLDLAAGT